MLPKRLAREVIYENEWVCLYADEVQYPDGRIIPRHHLVHFPYESAAVVIQNEKDEILLIRSNRYTTQSHEWEIPAGRVEQGETAEAAALREAEEETGCKLASLELLIRENPSNGISDQTMVVYKARVVSQGAQGTPEEVMDMRWVSQEKLREMIAKQEIHCGFSLVGLLMVLCGM